MRTLFGVAICMCDEDLQEPEVLDGIVFDANCHGVIGLTTEEEQCNHLY